MTVEGDYEAIQRRAFENYILELVREGATEEERIYLKGRGRELDPLVRKVELAGSYPETTVRLLMYRASNKTERWHTSDIWMNPLFFDDDGKQLRTGQQMAGDILMWARGG